MTEVVDETEVDIDKNVEMTGVVAQGEKNGE